ncbi:hypothetical protein MY978_06840 [Haemophilus influenzae]|uniref:hypothetical protein n=1 Tax=Haemophilus influenzae TaxID=727 RepID=UPI0001DDE055|nr:hypothetical protein [Haemophilus influenzae]TWV00831.1 hypothetical protein FRC22_09105 [Haemophilus influenzae]CBW28537.1 putative uncharacterized protein [Haemophilus influenzae 10810]
MVDFDRTLKTKPEALAALRVFSFHQYEKGIIVDANILKVLLKIIKELLMKYSIWQIAFAFSIPIFFWVSADLLRAIIELIRLFN